MASWVSYDVSNIRTLVKADRLIVAPHCIYLISSANKNNNDMLDGKFILSEKALQSLTHAGYTNNSLHYIHTILMVFIKTIIPISFFIIIILTFLLPISMEVR